MSDRDQLKLEVLQGKAVTLKQRLDDLIESVETACEEYAAVVSEIKKIEGGEAVAKMQDLMKQLKGTNPLDEFPEYKDCNTSEEMLQRMTAEMKLVKNLENKKKMSADTLTDKLNGEHSALPDLGDDTLIRNRMDEARRSRDVENKQQ